jgi:hypothetical protein
MVRVTRYVAGYVRWLFVFERRVRAAVDKDRARGARIVFVHGRPPAGAQEPRHQAGAGGARAAGLVHAFLSGRRRLADSF